MVLRVDEGGGLVPGYELKLNSYDLGVDIELHDAVQRLRFEHPEVRAVVITSGDGQGVLRRREHPDAGRLQPPVEGELLQVHQRDPQRHRGRHRALRPDLHRGGQRHRGRRRLRARAGLRRDPAHRRQLLGGLAARGAAARRAARHRRPDPRGRQAQVRRTAPTSSPPSAEGIRGSTAVDWKLVDEVVPRSRFARDRRASARRGRGRESTRPAGADGRRPHAAAPEITADGDRVPARDAPSSTATPGWSTSRCTARGRRPRRPRADPRRAPTSGRWP